jgi:hypothetical protein
MLASGTKKKGKAEADSTGLMGRFTMATGRTIRPMDQDELFTVTEKFTKVTS